MAPLRYPILWQLPSFWDSFVFFLMVGPSSIRWRHVCSASIPMLFLVHGVVLRTCTRQTTGVLVQGYWVTYSSFEKPLLMYSSQWEFQQFEEASKYKSINSSQVKERVRGKLKEMLPPSAVPNEILLHFLQFLQANSWDSSSVRPRMLVFRFFPIHHSWTKVRRYNLDGIVN